MPNPFAYPDELRAEGVRLCREEGISFHKVADQLGVTAPTVQDWVRAAEAEADGAASRRQGGDPSSAEGAAHALQERDI